MTCSLACSAASNEYNIFGFISPPCKNCALVVGHQEPKNHEDPRNSKRPSDDVPHILTSAINLATKGPEDDSHSA